MVKFVGEFLYFNATAALPALVMLVILRRQTPTPAENGAYFLSILSALLAILSTTVTFAGTTYGLKAEFVFLP
jgi:hypothetical protein